MGMAKGPLKDLGRSKAVQYYTELIVRGVLSLPKKPALIYFVFTWFHWPWQKAQPYHKSAAPLHLSVLEHYGVPQVSALDPFLPTMNDTKEREKVSKHYFCDFVHPRQWAHTFAAQLLA